MKHEYIHQGTARGINPEGLQTNTLLPLFSFKQQFKTLCLFCVLIMNMQKLNEISYVLFRLPQNETRLSLFFHLIPKY